MKKCAVMMLAMIAAAVFGAENLEVNSAFKVSTPGAKLPDGWLWNGGPRPVGTYEIVQINGKNAVKFVGEKNMLSAVYKTYFNVNPGEKYELSVNVTGKSGYVGVGAHLWGMDGKKRIYLSGDYGGRGVKLTGAPVTVRRVVTIPEKVKRGGVELVPQTIRLLFVLHSPAEAVFSDFTAKKLD